MHCRARALDKKGKSHYLVLRQALDTEADVVTGAGLVDRLFVHF